jgi:hypothetical protein
LAPVEHFVGENERKSKSMLAEVWSIWNDPAQQPLPLGSRKSVEPLGSTTDDWVLSRSPDGNE